VDARGRNRPTKRPKIHAPPIDEDDDEEEEEDDDEEEERPKPRVRTSVV